MITVVLDKPLLQQNALVLTPAQFLERFFPG
jgi:hypothetical protein